MSNDSLWSDYRDEFKPHKEEYTETHAMVEATLEREQWTVPDTTEAHESFWHLFYENVIAPAREQGVYSFQITLTYRNELPCMGMRVIVDKAAPKQQPTYHYGDKRTSFFAFSPHADKLRAEEDAYEEDQSFKNDYLNGRMS